ncbi:MAG: YciI family protein [Rhodocyclaceae bacterium]|nr:YciI family protein [Rhodocyclaceae bacterium]
MKHFVLIYEVVDDYVERRTPFRAEHLALAQAAKANGDLFLAGAFADPVDGALLVFQGETGAAAEAFAQADPYVKNGLVTSWRVREWTTVVGDTAMVALP